MAAHRNGASICSDFSVRPCAGVGAGVSLIILLLLSMSQSKVLFEPALLSQRGLIFLWIPWLAAALAKRAVMMVVTTDLPVMNPAIPDAVRFAASLACRHADRSV
jgi:hypothetical protein